MKNKILLFGLYLLFFNLTTQAQSTFKVKGKIVDATSNEFLTGTSISIKGTTIGTTADIDGNFLLDAPFGKQQIVISFIGYKTLIKDIDINSDIDLQEIKLDEDAIGIAEVEIIASVAVSRKTPVALSSLSAEAIQDKLGTQEFVELLNSTPGVYATKAGGGYGDSRINLRGFDSRNIAVMINGVPINGMESGKVYWSNWAGLSDVTRSMQVQRGLGASKVAVPSIGGTINILTKTTDAKRGGNVKLYMGNDGYLKRAITLSTGMNENGWATTMSLAKTTGDGFVDGTEFEGYSYFLNISKKVSSDQILSLTVFGAAQEHNQRYNRLTIKKYREMNSIKYNKDWGYKNGQKYNLSQNYYHKPQAILNHFWNITDKLSFNTAVYASIGQGGGRRGFGNTKKFNDNYRDNQINFDKIIDENIKAGNKGSESIIANSVNNHSWVGILFAPRYKYRDLTITGGIDTRYYIGEHYYEIEDLLGGEFYKDASDNKILKSKNVGDKVNFNNDAKVFWSGLFGQVEYDNNKLTTFISGAVSNKSYKRIDYFKYTGDEQETDWVSFIGYSTKMGANYNINDNHNVFFNTGIFSRQTDFKYAFLNHTNTINSDAKNETVFSVELGYGFKSKLISANINAYHTMWYDKSLVKSQPNRDGGFDVANISGVDAVHHGIEFDAKIRPLEGLTINLMGSIADWKWASDVENVQIMNEKQEKVGAPINVYLKDVHVGDAAQTTYSVGADYYLIKDLKVGATLNYFSNLYAFFQTESRTKANAGDSWKLPDYGIVNLSCKYKFNIAGVKAIFYGKVDNLLDTEYIPDASDGSGHNQETARVYYGFTRTFSVGFNVKF